MPIGKENDLPVWTSARDIGNIAAGYIAGINGLSWTTTRLGFDALESYQKGRLTTETSTTQYAQRLGFNIGNTLYYNSQIHQLSRLPSYGTDILRNLKPMPKCMITKF
jgi:predicted NAD/FAD-binding protein